MSCRDSYLGLMSYDSVCYLFFAQWKRRKLVMKQPEQISECSCYAWTFLSVVSGFPTTALRGKNCPRRVLVGEQKHPYLNCCIIKRTFMGKFLTCTFYLWYISNLSVIGTGAS